MTWTEWKQRLFAAWQALRGRPSHVTLPASTHFFQLGMHNYEIERTELVTQHLEAQRDLLKLASKADLVEAVVDRDRLLAQMGRELADGRMAGRQLKELLRGTLHGASMGGKLPMAIEQMLVAAGAPSSDLRQLRQQIAEYAGTEAPIPTVGGKPTPK
ncbi:MAG TPA: hypothetical protein VN903_30935 [Polyangia bacterium]|nr:hypothetical protein [Polyangia bacterium]